MLSVKLLRLSKNIIMKCPVGTTCIKPSVYENYTAGPQNVTSFIMNDIRPQIVYSGSRSMKLLNF